MIHQVVAITADILDADACRTFWRGSLHPEGPCCPKCHTCLTGRQAETWKDGGKVRCHSCKTYFTWRTETPLSGKSIDERQLFLIASLAGKSTPLAAIAESTELNGKALSIDTVRRWVQRLQEFAVVQG